jgi:hypothetical protein
VISYQLRLLEKPHNMAILQIRIFVPSGEPPQGWAETVAGRVIKPITQEYLHKGLEWFWFSRYASFGPDSADCDFDALPETYKQPLSPGELPYHRSVRFRFEIADNQQANFKKRLQELLKQGGYPTSEKTRPYPAWLEESGGNRFLGNENRLPGRKEQRSKLVLSFYQITSQLVLDALVGPDADGRFKLETNDDPQNPLGSTFESLHHIFCNITQPPLQVYVTVGTAWTSETQAHAIPVGF